MDALIKGIEFEKLDSERLMDFLNKSKKTQMVDIKCFHGQKHVIHSILQTLKAFRNKENIAKTDEIEFLVRLSAQRQIKRALEACNPSKKCVFISWSKNAKKIFSGFKKEFKAREHPLKEPDADTVKKAIERTSTFYLVS
jgi:KEOPS complex subunit Cgi121